MHLLSRRGLLALFGAAAAGAAQSVRSPDSQKSPGAASDGDVPVFRGGTAMRDAIRMSIDHLKEKAKKDKKVLVVVTDGNDNTSAETLENLLRKAQRSEVLIYCIGLLSEEEPREARSARRALKALTEASGGLDYYPKDLGEVERVTPQIAHEIRNQYLLAYSPTNPALDGSFRKIEVKVKGYNNPMVRTRSGYYATPESASKTSAFSGK